MTLSRAQLAAMPRTTPTALAEAAYARERAPQDLGVPALRSVYRPTLDGKRLVQIGEAAVEAFERDQLPASETRTVAAAISVELLLRYPHDEMVILEKWDHARARDAVFTYLPGGNQHRLQLPAPVLIPTGAATDFVADPTRAGIPIPLGTADFFARAAEVAEARAAFKWRLSVWPGQFKNNAKRWPRWEEIAAAWPLIGLWFEKERAA